MTRTSAQRRQMRAAALRILARHVVLRADDREVHRAIAVTAGWKAPDDDLRSEVRLLFTLVADHCERLAQGFAVGARRLRGPRPKRGSFEAVKAAAASLRRTVGQRAVNALCDEVEGRRKR